MRRHNNTNTIKVETEKYIYLVNLERTKNGQCGQPRYRANVIVLMSKEDGDRIKEQTYFYTYNYTFGGHYCGDENEAKWLCEKIEETQK